MPTAAQIANTQKVRVVRDIVRRLRARGYKARRDTWRELKLDKKFWEEIETYDLNQPERQSHLSKIAFPDANREAVDAALCAGNNPNQLYLLACGRAHIPKDSDGRFVAGKKGLKIVKDQET
jgi:hypothetical protein